MAIDIFKLDEDTIKVGQFEIIENANKQAGEVIAITKAGFDVATADKIIRFKKLQFPNKKMLNIADILNGKDLSKYVGHIIG